MRIPHHLRRGKTGIFHFRIVVPLRLRAALGRTEIKQSLNTRNPREATPRDIARGVHGVKTVAEAKALLSLL